MRTRLHRLAVLAVLVPVSAGRAGAESRGPVELAREIQGTVETIRGLRFVRPVPVEIVDDAKARAHFASRASKLWPREKLEHDQSALIQLGVLPAGVDILASLLDVLEEQAGGYYDPETGAFYVLDDIPPHTAPILMAHELTHALDDQHFQIDRLLSEGELTDDRSTALAAVLEGSGTLVQALYTAAELRAGRLPPDLIQQIQESEAGQARKLKAAPHYLQRALIAPYTLGPTFALRGDPLGGSSRSVSEDLNTLFRRPPSSTEQILHPEKYWSEESRDDPLPLELPALEGTLGEGWTLASRGRLGELNLAILTGAGVPDLGSAEAAEPRRWTNDAAAGIGGDVYHHYSGRDGEKVTVLATVWDREQDAREFVAGLLPVRGRRTFHALDRVVLVAGDAPEPARLAAAAMSGLRTGNE
jgi:hypothetical protein